MFGKKNNSQPENEKSENENNESLELVNISDRKLRRIRQVSQEADDKGIAVIKRARKSWFQDLPKKQKFLAIGIIALLALGALGAIDNFSGNKGSSLFSRTAETVGLKEKPANPLQTLAGPDGTLQLSKEYIYAGSRMLAIEDYGLSGASQPSAPSAPAAPTLNVVSQTQINVYWNASPAGENVASYKLRINGSHLITGITYTSFPATSLSPGTSYTFEVAAVNSSGVASAWSASVTATTQSNAPAPSVPTGSYTETVSSTQVNYYWNASPSSENVTGYNVRLNGAQVLTGFAYTSYPFTGLATGTNYTFEVAAVNSSGGVSGWSAPVTGTTAAAPSAPTINAADVVSSTQINLYWSSAQTGENVAGYNVRMNGAQVLTGFTYTSYPFGSLSPNTTYTFEVQAVDAAGGASAWSPSASATTAP